MKKIFLLFMIAFLGLQGFSQSKKLNDLVGIWQIVGEDSSAYLEVIDSSTILLSYNGEKKKIMDHKFDFQKFPIWFDFSTRDTSSVVTIKSLLEVVNDNTIKWQLFIDEERPNYFTASKGEMLFLRKTKSIVNVLVSN